MPGCAWTARRRSSARLVGPVTGTTSEATPAAARAPAADDGPARAAMLRDEMTHGWGHPGRGFEEAQPRSLPLKANPHMHLFEAALAWEEASTAVGWRGMAALVALLLVALAIGHVLGGPGADERTALAIACATRHIGVAVVVATGFRGPKTAVLIAAYVVASALVAIPYLRWRRRRSDDGAGAARPAT